MAERLKAHAWKVCRGLKPLASSNLAPSAISTGLFSDRLFFLRTSGNNPEGEISVITLSPPHLKSNGIKPSGRAAQKKLVRILRFDFIYFSIGFVIRTQVIKND